MKINRKSTLLALIITTATIFSGCMQIESSKTSKNYYLLNTKRLQSQQQQKLGAVEVREFSISKSFAESSLIYRSTEHEYETDYYNRFFASPGSIISNQTCKWLEDSGLFASVTTSGSSVTPELIIKAYIKEIYGDFRPNLSPSAIMQIQFIVLDNTTKTFNMKFEKTYSAEISLAQKSPEGLIEAYNKGLARILTDFENDIIENI